MIWMRFTSILLNVILNSLVSVDTLALVVKIKGWELIGRLLLQRETWRGCPGARGRAAWCWWPHLPRLRTPSRSPRPPGRGVTRLVLYQGSIVTTPPPLTPHTHQDNVALLLAVDRVLGIELRLSALVTVFGVRILLIEHALSFAFLTKVDLNMLWWSFWTFIFLCFYLSEVETRPETFVAVNFRIV